MINHWKEIRKIIVHYNSISKSKNLDISKLPTLRIEGGRLKISGEKDILDFLYLVEEYLKIIIDLINEKYNLIKYSTV